MSSTPTIASQKQLHRPLGTLLRVSSYSENLNSSPFSLLPICLSDTGQISSRLISPELWGSLGFLSLSLHILLSCFCFPFNHWSKKHCPLAKLRTEANKTSFYSKWFLLLLLLFFAFLVIYLITILLVCCFSEKRK